METRKKVKITFLGGAGTVTGSKTLIEFGSSIILVDCGLFQGLKDLRERNRKPFPIHPSKIDAILLTHAHLDHCGYLPVLVRDGFEGKIYCTKPTKQLTEIILADSGKIQEEDAERANRYGYSKHEQAKPLYTAKDAAMVRPHFSTHNYDEWVILDAGIKFQFLNAGHIIGSAMIELKINGEKFLFSGDVGRKDPLLLYPPKKVEQADYIVLESTYGDREHQDEDVKSKLAKVINETYQRKGILMIPSFAVERTQEMIYLLYQLMEEDAIPRQPIYLDSPMGVKASLVFDQHQQWQDVSIYELDRMYTVVDFVRDFEQSKAIVLDKKPKIILAGSGMIEGGRILHYLSHHAQDPKNTLLFVGFQAAGTRGRAILEGTKHIKFFGEYHEIACQIESISSMSAHGDRMELLEWLRNFDEAPKRIFLNHGEPHQSDAFRVLIETKLGWNVSIPQLGESFDASMI
jgi:metallo-beta-lactamase family protein